MVIVPKISTNIGGLKKAKPPLDKITTPKSLQQKPFLGGKTNYGIVP